MSAAVLPGAGPSSGPGSAAARRRPRWPAAAALLALALAALALALTAADGPGGPAVGVRTPDGGRIAHVPLDGDTFAVGYRNSIYGTLAEERYRVLPDGRFELVQIAAEQVAVLEEYYAVPGAPRPAPPGDRLDHVVDPDPARPAVFAELNIAATDLGERTLYVPGAEPVPLWRLVTGEDPTVLLQIEERG